MARTPLTIGAILTALLVGAGAWFWPVYGFLAHAGRAPLPPWGWIDIASEPPSTENVGDSRYARAGERVLAAMADHRARIDAPGMSAAVAIDGEIVWKGAVGWADIAKNRPLTPDTIVRIGSTSKAVTATALARLVQQGVLSLDTPIDAYMSSPNAEWAGVTPRMLASHSAGIPHYGDVQNDPQRLNAVKLNKSYRDVRDALEVFDQSPLLFAPGTDFEYSSLGTVLLGAVMSEAAEIPYREIIKDQALTPAGAGSTIVSPARTDDPNIAVPYVSRNGRFRPWRPVDLSHRLPGGGWASTSADLARIGSLWLDEDFIAQEIRDEFWRPQTLSSGEVNEQDYAIGWRWREWDVDGYGLARNANHGGVSRGGQSWLLVYPDLRMAIAFNMNGRTEEFPPFGAFHDEIFVPFARTVDELNAD